MPSGNQCGAHCLRPGRLGLHGCQGWRPMCSDVSSLSDWMCSRCLFGCYSETRWFCHYGTSGSERDTVLSLCGSRTDANKDNQVGMTTLTTVVLQRLEASTRSSTFSIKCGDDGFHHESLDVQYLSSTGDLHRAHTKVPHVSHT